MILNYDDIPQKSIYYIWWYVINILKDGDIYNIQQVFDLYRNEHKKDNISFNLFLYSIDRLMMIWVVLSTDTYIKNVFTKA